MQRFRKMWPQNAEIIELADKNVKIAVINMLHMFKRIEKYMNMTKREMEDTV